MQETSGIFGRTHARRIEPEAMDDPTLDAGEHARALRGLARLNLLSGAAGRMWKPIEELCRESKEPVRVLDIATGSGDVPVGLMQRASRYGRLVCVDGCDVSEIAVESARARVRAESRLMSKSQFFVHDVLEKPLPCGYDVVICSLFLHHLSEDEAIGLLREMARCAGRLVVVNDLVRRTGNGKLVRAGSRIVSRSWVVRKDAALSINAAFSRRELYGMAAQTGMEDITIRGGGLCRMQLTWKRELNR